MLIKLYSSIKRTIMKKSLLTVILVAVAAVSASAQSAVGSVYVKPMAGGVLSTFAGSDVEGAKMKFGLVAGAELGYQRLQDVTLMVQRSSLARWPAHSWAIRFPTSCPSLVVCSIPCKAVLWIQKVTLR